MLTVSNQSVWGIIFNQQRWPLGRDSISPNSVLLWKVLSVGEYWFSIFTVPLCMFWVSDHLTLACRVKSRLWVLTISWVRSHHSQDPACMYREREKVGNPRTFPLSVPHFLPLLLIHVWVFCFPVLCSAIVGGAIRCQVPWRWSYRWLWAICDVGAVNLTQEEQAVLLITDPFPQPPPPHPF